MLKALQRVKKEAFKFQFTISYQELVFDCYNKWYPKSVHISWSRRDKLLSTKKHPVVADPDVSQRFLLTWPIPENQVAVVTLFRASSSAFFEEKNWSFEVYEGEQLLATQKFNLSEHASTIPKQVDLKLTLSPASAHLKAATLHLTISSSLIRHARTTDDDGLSLNSFQSGGSQTRGSSDEDARATRVLKAKANMFRSFRVKKNKASSGRVEAVKDVTERYNLSAPLEEYETSFGAEKSFLRQHQSNQASSPVSSLSSLNPSSSSSLLKPPPSSSSSSLLKPPPSSLSSSSSSKPPLSSPVNQMTDPSEELLSWCRQATRDHALTTPLDNLTTAWRNGLAFCAIIHHFRPHLIDFDALDANDIAANCKVAFEAGEKLGVPRLMDPQDMLLLKVPDKLSIITYLFQLKSLFAPSSHPQPYSGKKRTPSHFKFSSDKAVSPVSKPFQRNELGWISGSSGGGGLDGGMGGGGGLDGGRSDGGLNDSRGGGGLDGSRRDSGMNGGSTKTAFESNPVVQCNYDENVNVSNNNKNDNSNNNINNIINKAKNMNNNNNNITHDINDTNINEIYNITNNNSKKQNSALPSSPEKTLRKTEEVNFKTSDKPELPGKDVTCATTSDAITLPLEPPTSVPSLHPPTKPPIPPSSPSSSIQSPSSAFHATSRHKLMTRKQLYNPFDSDSDDDDGATSLNLSILDQPIPTDTTTDAQANNLDTPDESSARKPNGTADLELGGGLEDSAKSRQHALRDRARMLMAYAGKLTNSPISLFSRMTGVGVVDEERNGRLREQAKRIIAGVKKPVGKVQVIERDTAGGEMADYYFNECTDDAVVDDGQGVKGIGDELSAARDDNNTTTSQGNDSKQGTSCQQNNKSLYLQREVEKVERDGRRVDEVAVRLEGMLRKAIEEGDKRKEMSMLQDWFSLVNHKNALIRRQAQLNIEQDEEDLERMFAFLSRELRSIMELAECEKSDEVRERERMLMAELVQIVDRRDEMVRMMDETEQAILLDQASHRGVQLKLRQEQHNCLVM